MKQPQKDIIIFGSHILGLSIIGIWIAVTFAFENGIVFGIVFGVGILLCVGERQSMKEPSQSFGDVIGQ